MGFPALAFAVGAAYLPGIFSAASMPRWWVIAVGLPLVSTIDPRSMSTPVLSCLLGAVAWSAALLWRDPMGGALDFYFFLLLVGVAVAASDCDHCRDVVEWFGWGVAVSTPFCLLQWFGWSPVQQASSPAGLFMSSEVMAETAAPVFAWAVFRRRWWLAAAMAVPLALCFSRVSVAAAMVGLAFGWRPCVRWAKPAALAAVLAAAAMSVFALGIEKESTAMTRAVLWLAAAQSMSIGGAGPGWWAGSHQGYLEEFAHSDALQAAVEIGAGSLLLLAVPLLLLLRRNQPRAEASAFVVICVETVVSFPLHLPATGFLAAVVAGFLARDRGRVLSGGLAGGDLAGATVRREPSPA